MGQFQTVFRKRAVSASWSLQACFYSLFIKYKPKADARIGMRQRSRRIGRRLAILTMIMIMLMVVMMKVLVTMITGMQECDVLTIATICEAKISYFL